MARLLDKRPRVLERPHAPDRPKVIRQLGHMERLESAIHLLDQYSATLVTCRYAVPDNLAIPDAHQSLVDTFDHAVARTVLEHPLLQVGLVNEDSKRPGWAELGSIDLAHHIQWTLGTSTQEYNVLFDSVLRTQVDAKFPNLGKRPGWRVEVVRPENEAVLDIIFASHHSYTDGMGARFFHEGLLGNLSPETTNKKLPSLTGRVLKLGGVAERFTPPQESLGKYTVTPCYAVSAGWRELLPSILIPESATYASWAPIVSRPVKTRIRGVTVNHEALSKVIAACRGNGTTLTGLLHGIVLVSLAGQLPEDRAAGFQAMTARDMRPCTPAEQPLNPWFEPAGMIGMNVTGVLHEYSVKNVARVRAAIRAVPEAADTMNALADTVWSVAKNTRRDIQRDIDLGSKNTYAGLARLVGDFRAHCKTALTKPRRFSWDVSNIGVVKGDVDGAEWEIQRARFSVSAWVTGTALQICAVSVKGGDLAVDVTWQDGAVDVEVGERVAADLEAWLKHLGV